jgi:membrane fusion protein, multidrug efflux system
MNADLIQAKEVRLRLTALGGAATLALLALAGCGRGQPQMGAMPPPQVGVITVQPQVFVITNELPGRVDPVQIAQVNARVDGVVLRREFTQGANVTNGQVLYLIDPAPYQASLDSARAALAQMKANETAASLLAKRYQPLVGISAVSKQNYDNAVSAAAQAKASVAEAEAAEKIAEINLGYCTVTAPISGRIGPALVTVGALASSTAATEMAVIQQMDPIYVDFTEGSAEVLQLEQRLQAGQLTRPAPGEAAATLTLPDGSPYPHPGKLLFSDITVNPSSGMVTLRAEFPNTDGLLLPGMFVTGHLEQALAPQTILAPQPAVIINPDGSASVMLVVSNKVTPQPVQLGQAVGGDWVIKGGLTAGEQVMVDGFQKAFPGMTVVPVPAEAAENPKPAAAGK